MAKIVLKHNPELTKEALKEKLSKIFESKGYEVGFSKLIGAQIYVKKNGWVGAAISIKQKADSTVIRANGYAPSTAVRLLMYGLITILILMPKWNKLVKEIREELEKSDLA